VQNLHALLKINISHGGHTFYWTTLYVRVYIRLISNCQNAVNKIHEANKTLLAAHYLRKLA